VPHSPRRPDYWQDPVDLYLALNVAPDPWDVEGWFDSSALDGGKKETRLDVAELTRLRPFQAESGQLVIDKERHWDVLEYLLFLNTHDKFIYAHALGDKDTYRLAFTLAGKEMEYWQCPFAPALPLHFIGEELMPKAQVCLVASSAL